MRVLRLQSENVKRLSVVDITPEGSVVVIGGRNRQGKTSVIDSIEYALGGALGIPGEPIRDGAETARIVLDLGDLIVTRNFTASGSTLVVKSRDGAKYPSPQAMIDKLYSALSFDPLKFERMDKGEARAALAELVGFDTSDLDAQRKRLFDERTLANREVKTLDAVAASKAFYEEAPAEEVSLASITAELDAAEATRNAVEEARRVYDTKKNELEATKRDLEDRQAEVEELRAKLAHAEARVVTRLELVTKAGYALEEARIAGAKARELVIDSAPIKVRLGDASSLNAKVRANKELAFAAEMLKDSKFVADELTAKIDAIDVQRESRLAAVVFPVAGLGLSNDGITLNGLPFEQASAAERIDVSCRIGLAMHPKLRILLVRNGSLLDSAAMKQLSELAEAADAQVWVERVSETSEGVSVMIEDGHVVALEAPVAA